jgi:hypothetical protein
MALNGVVFCNYHGTNADFDKFNFKNFGKTDDGWWGVGIYFKSDIETAKIYGKTIKKVKLHPKNPLILPVSYSGEFLYNVLKNMNVDLPNGYKKYSAMKIIREMGKQNFTNVIKKRYDMMIINYSQGTKEAVVFDEDIIEILMND